MPASPAVVAVAPVAVGTARCFPRSLEAPRASLSTVSFTTFQEFYPFYLGEHANRTSRRLHVVGTLGALAQLALAVVQAQPRLLLSGLVTGYALAWVGHYFFEKNTPATFKHPLYSLRGDFRMAREVLTGRIPW